tara:strand:+ start:157 stop:417 length:261 start_codon:yes stop_codon:yes gene_type:complete
MKQTIKRFILSAFILAGLYLLLGFIESSLNALGWHVVTKIFAMASLVIWFAATFFGKMINTTVEIRSLQFEIDRLKERLDKNGIYE